MTRGFQGWPTKGGHACQTRERKRVPKMPQSLIATSHTGNTMQIRSYSDFSIIPMFNAQPVYALGYSARYSTVFAHGSSSLLSKKPPRIAPEHLSHGGPFAVSPRTCKWWNFSSRSDPFCSSLSPLVGAQFSAGSRF